MVYQHNPNLPDVTDVIPHRPPHLWLDGVIDIELGVSATGFWTPGDEQYAGHFPDMPILQGVKQLESVAQLGGYLALFDSAGSEQELGVLFAHSEPYWMAPVFPGDTLHLTVDMQERDKKTFTGMGTVAVNDEIACKSVIEGKIMKKEVLEKMLQRERARRAQSGQQERP